MHVDKTITGGSILCDREIVELLNGDPPLVESEDRSRVETMADESQVQAASLDLHVGSVYEPQSGGSRGRDQHVAQYRGESTFVLKPGRTAVVITREILNLPPHIAGFGFPPARVAVDGILMTNPGHVDPGFRGSLRLTLINMGREELVLTQHVTIFTLLMAHISSPDADWATRNESVDPANQDAPTEALERLSSDFMEIEGRIDKEVRAAVRNAATWLSAIAAGVVLAFTFFGSIAGAWFVDEGPGGKFIFDRPHELLRHEIQGDTDLTVDDLSEELESLRTKLEVATVLNRIEQLEQQRSAGRTGPNDSE